MKRIIRSLAILGTVWGSAHAAEGGISFYIPRVAVPMAGFLPPPGVFFDSSTYFYQGKITGGRNTQLGGNIVAGVVKGRVTAVGGTIGYTFTLGHTPISTRIKVLKEVEVEDRFRGTIGWLQVSFPLWVAPQTRGRAL